MDILTALPPEYLLEVEALSDRFVGWVEEFKKLLPTWGTDEEEDRHGEENYGVTPKIELEKPKENANRFKGFQEYGHILLMGASGTGKTSYVTTQLVENWFAFDYTRFVYFGPSNTKDSFNALFMGAKADLSVNKDNNIEDKNVEMYLFENDADLIKITSMFNKKNDKTLMFVDDLQSSPKVEKAFQELALRAKNSNITLIVTTHFNNGSRANSSLRQNSRYLIFFKPTEHTLRVYTNTKAGDVIINSLATLRAEHHIVIFDSLEHKFYFATGLKKQIFDHEVQAFKRDGDKPHRTSLVVDV